MLKEEDIEWTPLYTAVSTLPHREVVQLLLDKRANPNLPDGKGYTPLQMARENREIDRSLTHENVAIYDEIIRLLEDAMSDH